jgi:hypothetical protein
MPVSGIASRRAGRIGGALVTMFMLAALLPAVASAATAPTITSPSSTNFTVGVAGSFTVTAAGVPTPSIGESGPLPSGVTYTDNGNGTGTLAGTPAAATNGIWPLTFTAANGNLPDAVQGFSLVVSAGTSPTITSTASTAFTVGVAGSFTVTATGTPTPSIGDSGALPTGVTFVDNGNGTGTLAGTPAAATNGTYAITFTAANGNLPNAVQSFTLFVTSGSSPAITSAATATFTVGVAGSFTVTATGSPVPSIVRSGSALPTGVTYVDNGNGTGTLAGTPAAATNGSYAMAFTAANGNPPPAVQGFTLVVSTGSAPTITSAATVTFSVGVAGSFTVTATGSPTPSIVRSGSALPAGVTFVDHGNGTATLSGTPAAGTNGSYAFTFTAANGNPPPAVQSFTLVVGTVGPSVTINQATGQIDPTASSPILFSVVFGTAVTGFATGDVTVTGTAGGTKVATVTAIDAMRYTVAVSGMTTAGTVIASIPAGVAQTATGGPNLASTSTDNSVTWVPVGTTLTITTSAPTPPGAHDPVITWGQGITLGVSFLANGAGKSVQIQAMRDGTTWSSVTTLTMDASGSATYYYTPVTNLFYRAIFVGTADLAATASNQVRTVVRQIALLRPTHRGVTSIPRGRTVTFTTTVRPSRPELTPASVTYWIYVSQGGTWRLFARRNVSAGTSGIATLSWTFSTSGLWYVRSMANPTPYNANSVQSPIEQYRVS